MNNILTGSITLHEVIKEAKDRHPDLNKVAAADQYYDYCKIIRDLRPDQKIWESRIDLLVLIMYTDVN